MLYRDPKPTDGALFYVVNTGEWGYVNDLRFISAEDYDTYGPYDADKHLLSEWITSLINEAVSK